MGIYNTYEGIQLKVADDLRLAEYGIGEKVDIPNGVYVGYGGFVVVMGGRLVDKLDKITTSWGDEIKADAILDNLNPLTKVLEEAKKEKK